MFYTRNGQELRSYIQLFWTSVYLQSKYYQIYARLQKPVTISFTRGF